MRLLPAAALCVAVASSVRADEPPANAFEIDAAYTGEVWRQMSGGVASGSRYLDNLDISVAIDGEQALGLDGLQLYGHALYNNGHALAEDLTGAVQGVSNIETSGATRLYELWSQWQFGTGAQSIRVGLYDLNSEFDSIETAGLFIHPSHGIGADFAQTGHNGPSIFPVTALAVRALTSFGPWTVQIAALDAVPGDPDRPERSTIRLSRDEGALLVGELNYRSPAGVRVGAGYWRYTASFDDLHAVDALGEPQHRDDNAGVYLLVESPMLFAPAPDRGLNVFLRAGLAQARVNPIGRYLGAGAVYSGVFAAGRDQFGLAIAIAHLGEPFRLAQSNAGLATDAREHNYELTYRFAVTESFALQADAQYVRNPGMSPQLASGWIVGLRFELSCGWGM